MVCVASAIETRGNVYAHRTVADEVPPKPDGSSSVARSLAIEGFRSWASVATIIQLHLGDSKPPSQYD